MTPKQKITTFLWFDDNAEQAANHYISIFNNSKIVNVARYGDTGPGPKGTVMTVTFQLEGQEFIGWLKDKFGLSWQVVPAAFFEMMQDKDPEKSKRVMEAMLQMKKMDLARLEQAYNAA